MPKLSLITLALLLFIIFFWTTASLLLNNRLDASTPLEKFEPLLTPKSTTIYPKNPGLNIIYLSFKNPSLASHDQYTFTVTDPSGAIVVTTPFSGANVGDPDDLRFQFPPISSVRPLTITITPNQLNSPSSIQVGVDTLERFAYRSYFRLPTLLDHFVYDSRLTLHQLTTNWVFVSLWAVGLGFVGLAIYNKNHG